MSPIRLVHESHNGWSMSPIRLVHESHNGWSMSPIRLLRWVFESSRQVFGSEKLMGLVTLPILLPRLCFFGGYLVTYLPQVYRIIWLVKIYRRLHPDNALPLKSNIPKIALIERRYIFQTTSCLVSTVNFVGAMEVKLEDPLMWNKTLVLREAS